RLRGHGSGASASGVSEERFHLGHPYPIPTMQKWKRTALADESPITMGTSAPDNRPPTVPLYAVAAVLVVASITWFLLKELAPVLRPLLLAIILAYVLLPYHSWLRKRVTAPVSIVLLASFTAAALFGLALAVYL